MSIGPNEKTSAAESLSQTEKLMRIASRAVAKAQEENRRLGVPNVYSINGRIYYELPSGELSLEDPWVEGKSAEDTV